MQGYKIIVMHSASACRDWLPDPSLLRFSQIEVIAVYKAS